jgi:hypothetical protein
MVRVVLVKEVMPLVRQKFPTLNKEHFIFIDDGKRNSFKWILSLNYTDFIKQPVSYKLLLLRLQIAGREKLANRLTQDGIQHLAIQAINTVILDEVEIGEGSLLCPFTCLTSNIKIGKFHANIIVMLLMTVLLVIS